MACWMGKAEDMATDDGHFFMLDLGQVDYNVRSKGIDVA